MIRRDLLLEIPRQEERPMKFKYAIRVLQLKRKDRRLAMKTYMQLSYQDPKTTQRLRDEIDELTQAIEVLALTVLKYLKHPT